MAQQKLTKPDKSVSKKVTSERVTAEKVTEEKVTAEKVTAGKLIVGNWKMHGDITMAEPLLAAISVGCAGLSKVQVAVCPSFVYLGLAAARLSRSKVAWGGQSVASTANGAFTGEVSATQLADLRCRYVLIGHSERRALFGETDAQIALKITQSINAGLTPIICVGETLAQRQAGAVDSVISEQLKAALAVLNKDAQFVVAYEPVWAIGTGETASPAQAQAVHLMIRNLLSSLGFVAKLIPILYGGSVKANNAEALFAMEDIDGGLIGGAALNATEFLAICTAAQAA